MQNEPEWKRITWYNTLWNRLARTTGIWKIGSRTYRRVETASSQAEGIELACSYEAEGYRVLLTPTYYDLFRSYHKDEPVYVWITKDE